MFHMLAREVLRLQSKIARDLEWEVMVDMFIYRDPSEAEKQEEVKDRLALENNNSSWTASGNTQDFAQTSDEWTGGNFAGQDEYAEGNLTGLMQ